MVIFLYGNDTYRSRQRLHALKDAFCSKFDSSGINVVHLDGETLVPEDFHRHMRMQGFLAPKRFIIVERLVSGGRTETQQLVAEQIAAAVEDDDAIIVMWEAIGEETDIGTAKKNAPGIMLWQALLNSARAEQFVPLDPPRLVQWILREAVQRGGTIEKPAAERLAAFLGPDLWSVTSELEKLIHYREGGAVGVADVEALVSAPVDDDIFRLTDAIGARDRQRALAVLEEQFLSGTAPLAMLGMIAWHIRTLISARSMLEKGITNHRTVAAQMKIHPFVAQKALKQSALFSMAELRQMFGDLVQIDRTIKSRPIDPRTLFTLFIVRAARKKQTA